MIKQLLILFWQICLFKRQPKDVPYGASLLAALILFNIILNIFELNFLMSFQLALHRVFVMLLMSASFVYLILSVSGYKSRFIQTFAALLGCGLILHFLYLPLLGLQSWLIAYPDMQFATLLTIFLLLALFTMNIWQVLITAHILRHAMAQPFALGVLVAFALLGSQILVYQWIVN